MKITERVFLASVSGVWLAIPFIGLNKWLLNYMMNNSKLVSIISLILGLICLYLALTKKNKGVVKDEAKTNYEIVMEVWKEGANTSKSKLSKEEMLVKDFACSCLQRADEVRKR